MKWLRNVLYLCNMSAIGRYPCMHDTYLMHIKDVHGISIRQKI